MKMTDVENVVSEKIYLEVDKLELEIDKKALKMQQNIGSWKIPFVILFFLIIGSCIGVYLFSSKVTKKMYLF